MVKGLGIGLYSNKISSLTQTGNIDLRPPVTYLIKRQRRIVSPVMLSYCLFNKMSFSLVVTRMLILGFSARLHFTLTSLRLSHPATRVMKINTNGHLHVFTNLSIFTDSY